MTSRPIALVFDAHDPRQVATFWSDLLRWEMVDDPSSGGFTLLPNDDTGFQIDVAPSEEEKRGQNQMHFDLTSNLEPQDEIVARALEVGAQHIDVGQRPEEGHVVLTDPEGNEFCVIPAGNGFLADCGFIGAVSSDGTQEVGYFWSKALDWPLVWDQDQETAIRSPHGGPKITWGGPPVAPKLGKNRLHFDIAPPAGSDQQDEVERLISLGAKRIDIGQGEVPWEVMADPDGNEFCVLTPR